jgi:hypothetical protein
MRTLASSVEISFSVAQGKARSASMFEGLPRWCSQPNSVAYSLMRSRRTFLRSITQASLSSSMPSTPDRGSRRTHALDALDFERAAGRGAQGPDGRGDRHQVRAPPVVPTCCSGSRRTGSSAWGDPTPRTGARHHVVRCGISRARRAVRGAAGDSRCGARRGRRGGRGSHYSDRPARLPRLLRPSAGSPPARSSAEAAGRRGAGPARPRGCRPCAPGRWCLGSPQ